MDGISSTKVTVVIPTYNQANFLDDAIQSVFGQTFHDFEIVVVNDGSTDETAQVLQRYHDVIRYIYQENQGLAGARNTGILAARGEYVALLDSDDIWDPTFLSSMMSLAKEEPDASVYFCGVRYIDENKQDLPQFGGTEVTDQDDILNQIIRSNFLIPSTIVFKRQAIFETGLFDISFRRLQDMELWIRLLRNDHKFAGLKNQFLVRYRVHKGNLSTDPVGGQQAARSLIEKHFGLDDGKWTTWPAVKRRAYGGLYRYCLLSSIQRQHNWESGVDFLRMALSADPTLTVDLDMFSELALGSQPTGYRGTSWQLDLARNAKEIKKLLSDLFTSTSDPFIQSHKGDILSTAFKAIGLVAYNIGDYSLCREYLLRTVRQHPTILCEKRITLTFLKSFLGKNILSFLRTLVGKK